MTGHKKYSTLRNKLRERVKAEKPIRTYKRREPGEEKSVSTVTKESYVKRHEFCFNGRDIAWALEKTPGARELFERKPEQFKPACNHPEDGLCVHREPTDEELAQVNERLSGGSTTAPRDLENPIRESQARRRRRSKAEKEPAKYFCTKCDSWHVDDDVAVHYKEHLKFKRGRGRPPKK